MKTIVQIVLWVVCVFLGYMIYKSVTGPIEFDKVKKERFAEVIRKLKDIRNSQEAYKSVNGRYANNFESLVTFVDTGNYMITQQRDSSYMEYDRVYQIDMLKEVTIIDTLGFVSVKDSLFGADSRYKTMMNIPVGKAGSKFELKAGILEENGVNIPVFESKALKQIILEGQDKNLIAKEKEVVSVDGVNGDAIIVGSMEEINTNGNWPKNYSNKQ